MELVIERTVLQSSLSLVQGIVERRNTVPILGHVLLEPNGANLRLAATDLEVGIRHLVVGMKVDQPGSVILPTARAGISAPVGHAWTHSPQATHVELPIASSKSNTILECPARNA